jgi:hypothetical protein
MASYGLQVFDSLGNKSFALDHYPFHLIDVFTVTGDSTGSKSYPDYSGKILYAVSHPINKSGLIPLGNHVTTVSGTTVSWNSIKPKYATTNTDCTIKVYAR